MNIKTDTINAYKDFTAPLTIPGKIITLFITIPYLIIRMIFNTLVTEEWRI